MNYPAQGNDSSLAEVSQSSTGKPRVMKVEHLINIKIPDECLDPDGGDCEHAKKPIKQIFNPI